MELSARAVFLSLYGDALQTEEHRLKFPTLIAANCEAACRYKGRDHEEGCVD